MDEGHKPGIADTQRRVQVPWLPTYREVRQLLGVWPGRSSADVVGLHRALIQLRGTPDNPMSWKDPDTWIPERLSGENRDLARGIWADTNKTVNPRYAEYAWPACQKYGLLAEDSDGILELTDRGREFIEHEFGETEALLDEQEGLMKILSIVAENAPAPFGKFVDPWAAYLSKHSEYRADSSIKDTLRHRLTNLLDRGLIKREGRTYKGTEAGRAYLKKVGAAVGTPNVPAGIKRYADDESGRAILAALADSIEFAHSLDPECWVTLFDGTRRDMRLYVGSTLMMVLEAAHERVEVTLLSGQLEDERRHLKGSEQVLREYTYPEGAKRYLLTWNDFIKKWESLRTVHQETMRQVFMKAPRSSAHRTDAVDFLNGVLARKLPRPEYVVDQDDPVDPKGDESSVGRFTQLTKSLEDGGLLFPRELVVNYILALQTKRFAILTGISGTGKTKIAMAVAQHFEHSEQRRGDTIPDDAHGIDAMPYMFKHPRVMIPVEVAANLDLLGPGTPLATRQISIRYPAGSTKLTYHRDERGATALLFRGEFKEWFRSNVKEGDRIWLRVWEGDTPESDELEIGLSETETVEAPVDNYVVIPVRPDWVDNRGLLGYLNPLTNEYSTTQFLDLLLRARDEENRAKEAVEKPHPFFVILDEMNLARVEHYFSDFLSALESGEPIPLHENEAIESGESGSGPQVPRKLKVPGNVLFTGTVNVDETTYMFSPKVLDRAFTIEFDQVDLKGFAERASSEGTSGLNLDGVQGPLDLLPSGRSKNKDWKPNREDWVEFSEETGEHHAALLRLHDILEAQHRHFGYRVANEIARFVNLAREQAKDTDAAIDAAFDLALLQKVLPKFHGTQQELQSLLEQIFHFAVHGGVYVPKKDQTVQLGDWRVVKGRLVGRPKTAVPSKAPAQTPSGDADTDANESDADTENAADAGTGTPAYPRTGAKVLRMLNRLRDRGFTSFIE